MTARHRSSYLLSDRPAVWSLALTGIVFAIDLSLPLGVAAAVPYTFAVLLALKARARWFAPALAALCWVLTVAKMGLVPERGTTEYWKILVNRGLALFAIGMTTFLGVRRRQAETERAEAEEKAREHLATLARMGRLHTAGQLATGLAHELNQPLTAVCLQAETATRLAEGGAQVPDLLPTLREIAEQSHRAADIVRGLRRMLRQDEPAPTQVDVNEVVRAVCRLIDTQTRRAGVDVRLELAPVPPVRGDRVQLEQVVLNLLQNAVEAVSGITTDPRVVTVATSSDGPDRVTVRFRDTGAGLPPGDEHRLFERFFTTKPNGMGMGLAISRSIVEAHGGQVWANAAPDRGAVFTFTLPAGKG
ncbi:MAG: Signal transduction histidine kinase [Gemmataceae bacterium]|nr:Signal transduction histidine kinase [Gemmataceae bacterium]